MKRYGCFRGLSSEQPRGIYRWTAARGREIDGGEDTSDRARAVRVRAGRRETAGGRHGTAPCVAAFWVCGWRQTGQGAWRWRGS
jgi:hypothetical protein